jgi:hypothetical protein
MNRGGVHTLSDIRARCDVSKGCWIWNGYAPRSRPSINLRGDVVLGQRVLAKLMGRDQERQPHQRWTAKCGNPLCLSPRCLILATHRECHQLASRSGRLKRDADQLARVRVARRACKSQKSMPDELIRWALESPQSSRVVAHALDVDPSAVRAWRTGKKRPDLSVGVFAQLMGGA